MLMTPARPGYGLLRSLVPVAEFYAALAPRIHAEVANLRGPEGWDLGGAPVPAESAGIQPRLSCGLPDGEDSHGTSSIGDILLVVNSPSYYPS